MQLCSYIETECYDQSISINTDSLHVNVKKLYTVTETWFAECLREADANNITV
jgi:hypothetical protein